MLNFEEELEKEKTPQEKQQYVGEELIKRANP